VLLVLDSLTRLAAQFAKSHWQPASFRLNAVTALVYTELPRLIERPDALRPAVSLHSIRCSSSNTKIRSVKKLRAYWTGICY